VLNHFLISLLCPEHYALNGFKSLKRCFAIKVLTFSCTTVPSLEIQDFGVPQDHFTRRNTSLKTELFLLPIPFVIYLLINPNHLLNDLGNSLFRMTFPACMEVRSVERPVGPKNLASCLSGHDRSKELYSARTI
jgi:hypothetical protein